MIGDIIMFLGISLVLSFLYFQMKETYFGFSMEDGKK